MINFENCQEIKKEKRIVLKEKQSKITFCNISGHDVRKIIIDGCLLNEGFRCDFLLILPDDLEYYIELKGSDITHAVHQIENTIEFISKDKLNQPKKSFIISTRCPLASTQIQNFKMKFKKNYRSELIIKNSPYEYNI